MHVEPGQVLIAVVLALNLIIHHAWFWFRWWGASDALEFWPAMEWQRVPIHWALRWQCQCKSGMVSGLNVLHACFFSSMHQLIHITCMHACKEETWFPCGCLWFYIWWTSWEASCYGLPFTSWLSACISGFAWYPKPCQCLYVILTLRLALFSCLMLAPGCLILMGPDCSSWGAPNLGTTLRSALNNSIGFLLRANVERGNLMMSRLLVKNACAHDHAYGLIFELWFGLELIS